MKTDEFVWIVRDVLGRGEQIGLEAAQGGARGVGQRSPVHRAAVAAACEAQTSLCGARGAFGRRSRFVPKRERGVRENTRARGG